MKIDVNNAFTLISLLSMLVVGGYRLAQIEADINTKIKAVETQLLTAVDQLKDNVTDRLYIAEKKLDIHLTEYSEKKQFVEYRLNANEKLIEHKFNRLVGWIKQITGFLNRESNFHIRDDQF
ncbi:hypothetical protein LC593_31250 [Nostoc sp. CHAB 5844]|nr:hypothetical protein [Nostoc sp. CHAB 5844]